MHPRENLQSAFQHIEDKSKDMDAVLAIYANAIPPEWFANMTSAAFDLRAAAMDARTASSNWAKLEDTLPLSRSAGRVKKILIVDNINQMLDDDIYDIPKISPQREIVFFAFYYYGMHLRIKDAIKKMNRLMEMILDSKDISHLDDTNIFRNLKNLTRNRSEPFGSEYFLRNMKDDSLRIEDYILALESKGLKLIKQPEHE